MKKLLKQLLAVTTAIMMAITLLPAMANAADAEVTPPSPIFNQDSATLEIEKHDSLGEVISGDTDAKKATFKIYQVAKVDKDTTTQLSYKVQEQFKNNITNDYIQNLGNLQEQSASALEEKAEELSKIENLTEYATYTTGDEAITIPKEDFGLYLVVEKDAPDGYNLGAPFFVDVPRTTEDGSKWNYTVVATPKNGSDHLAKKVAVVKDDKTVADKAAASVKKGDTLLYTVTGTLPYLTEKELAANNVKITISDTLTGGLAFDEPFSLVEFNINGVNVKTSYLPIVNEAKNQFTITIEANKEDKENYETNLNYIKSINGKSITLTYKAVVTDAVTYATAATNKATINAGKQTSNSDIPEVYTYAIKLNKKLGDKDAIKEDGVQFGLYTDPTCTDENRVGDIKTVENGSITFDGLVAEGEKGTTYYLKEEKTAQGYTLLSKPIAVTLIPQLESGQPTGKMKYTIDGNTTPTEGYTEPRLAETTITNNKGFNLPGTGGMGTYIFTIGGLVVMAGAVLLLVSSKKKRA